MVRAVFGVGLTLLSLELLLGVGLVVYCWGIALILVFTLIGVNCNSIFIQLILWYSLFAVVLVFLVRVACCL